MRNQIILLILISFWSSPSKGQDLPFLLVDFDVVRPEWKEYLQLSINQNNDTLYTAHGRVVHPGLMQCDRYDSNSLWLGVDRYVWESEKSLRIYHYQGFEEHISWYEDGRLKSRVFHNQVHQKEYSLEYEGSMIKRIAINDSLGYSEYVFLYQGQSERLYKVKQFLNGDLIAQIQLSYNPKGERIIEEYWDHGELKNLLTYSYNDESQLQGILVMRHRNGEAYLQEQHSYSFVDQKLKKVISRFYSGNSREEWLLRMRILDDQQRLIKEERFYYSNEVTKEIDNYSYQTEVERESILGLRSGR